MIRGEIRAALAERPMKVVVETGPSPGKASYGAMPIALGAAGPLKDFRNA